MTIQVFADTTRLGRIDLTDRVRSFNFRTRNGSGYAEALVDVQEPDRDIWLLQDHDADDALEFYVDGEPVYSGLIASARIRSGQMTLEAEGRALRMADSEVWRIYGDAEYSRWVPSSSMPSGFSADNNNRVYVGAGGGVTFTTGDGGSVAYPESGVELGGDVVRVLASAEVTITSGSWVAEIRTDAGAVLWSQAGAGTWDIDLAVAGGAAGLVVALRATADGTGEATFRLTQVVVRTLDPCTSTDIVTELLGLEGIDDSGVASSGLDVDQAVFDGQSRLTVVREMAALGDGEETWLFCVYDVAEFRAWDSEADWRLERGDLDDWEVEYRRDEVVNAVRTVMPDGYKTAWYTDSASIDRWGRRERTVQIQMTTQAEAARLAQVYLADHAWPVQGLRLGAGALARKVDSSLWPAYLIRAGDVIVLHDLIPDSDVTIRVAETEANRNGMRITPFGTSSRLEVILAARERQTAQYFQSAMSTAKQALSLAASAAAKFAGSSSGGGSGVGDMLKSVYDTDNNGVVDDADTVRHISGPVSVADYYNPAQVLVPVSAWCLGAAFDTGGSSNAEGDDFFQDNYSGGASIWTAVSGCTPASFASSARASWFTLQSGASGSGTPNHAILQASVTHSATDVYYARMLLSVKVNGRIGLVMMQSDLKAGTAWWITYTAATALYQVVFSTYSSANAWLSQANAKTSNVGYTTDWTARWTSGTFEIQTFPAVVFSHEMTATLLRGRLFSQAGLSNSLIYASTTGFFTPAWLYLFAEGNLSSAAYMTIDWVGRNIL